MLNILIQYIKNIFYYISWILYIINIIYYKYIKREICNFYINGHCIYGKNCTNLHITISEITSKLTNNAIYIIDTDPDPDLSNKLINIEYITKDTDNINVYKYYWRITLYGYVINDIIYEHGTPIIEHHDILHMALLNIYLNNIKIINNNIQDIISSM